MVNVLFVCTGNIFRSLTAEYALRRSVDPAAVAVSSAGTNNAPRAQVRADVAAYLAENSLDVARHQRRTLTRQMLQEADVIVAMSTEHQVIIRDRFAMDSLLFTEACGGAAVPLLDVDDLFAPEERHSQAAQQHIYKIIDQIIATTPQLAERLATGWTGPR